MAKCGCPLSAATPVTAVAVTIMMLALNMSSSLGGYGYGACGVGRAKEWTIAAVVPDVANGKPRQSPTIPCLQLTSAATTRCSCA